MKKDVEKHVWCDVHSYCSICVSSAVMSHSTHTVLTSHPETYPKPNLTKPHAGIYLSPNPNLSLTCQAQVFSDVH